METTLDPFHFSEAERRRIEAVYARIARERYIRDGLDAGMQFEEADDADDLYFCERCHAQSGVYHEHQPIEYDTNSGGDWWLSKCCGEDVYAHRIVLPLSPGRTRYIYRPEWRHDFDGSDYYEGGRYA